MFNVFVPPQQFLTHLAQSVEEARSRTHAFLGELHEAEGRTVEQSQTAVDAWLRLSRETWTYGMDLNAAWRKLAFGAVDPASSAPKS